MKFWPITWNTITSRQRPTEWTVCNSDIDETEFAVPFHRRNINGFTVDRFVPLRNTLYAKHDILTSIFVAYVVNGTTVNIFFSRKGPWPIFREETVIGGGKIRMPRFCTPGQDVSKMTINYLIQCTSHSRLNHTNQRTVNKPNISIDDLHQASLAANKQLKFLG